MKAKIAAAFVFIVVAILASYFLSQRPHSPESSDLGVTAPDPVQSNSLRLNGVFEVDVYITTPTYEGRYYEVICTIAPFGQFHVYERDVMLPGWRHIKTADGSCEGWIWLP